VTASESSESPEGEARAFVEALAARRFDAVAARFDAEMTAAMPVVALAELWRKLEDAGGSFQRIDGVETELEDGYEVARVTCKFAYRRKVLRLVFAEAGKLAGLFYGPVSKEMEETARAVVDHLARGDFARVTPEFDAIMRAALPADKLGGAWKQVVQRSGSFEQIGQVALVPAGGFWTVLLTCRFAKAEVVIKVVYDVRDQIVGLFFLPGDALAPWKPPEYAQADRFVERNVTLGASPSLPGVLSLPKGRPASPVVVLVHGSGPNDADESIGPNKVFKDIAWGLASRGVAVLRYVKRTRHAPAGVVSIKEEVLDGAAAAIDFALHAPELDSKRVVVLGHSQGGYLGPRIAADNPNVAALVLLAGPSRPLQDSLVDQLGYLSKLDPGNAEKKRLVEAARNFKVRVEDPLLEAETTVDVPGGSAEQGQYFLSLRGYQPTDVARKLTIPILVLQGGRDYQVTAPDFDGWKKALGGRPSVTLKQYPALNHLFIAGTGTPRPSEYETPGHVDRGVIDDIAAFVGRL
jgi:dienelactone hydrolase